uniref:Uncharacterized protein n=1 Tax=Callorhinchus milii TaxID=7868 RepID=A0A4W3GRM0_CALMI
MRRVAADTRSSCDSLIANGRMSGARAASGLLSAALSRHYRAHTDLCLWVGPGPSRGLVDVSRRDAAERRGTLRGLRFALCYGVLDSGYRRVMPTSEALALARTAVSHAAHRDAYSGGCVDVYTVGERAWERGQEGRAL